MSAKVKVVVVVLVGESELEGPYGHQNLCEWTKK